MKTLEQLAREAQYTTDTYVANLPGAVGIESVTFDAAGLARFRAACRAEALEEAAQLCDTIANNPSVAVDPGERAGAWDCAAAIREMK